MARQRVSWRAFATLDVGDVAQKKYKNKTFFFVPQSQKKGNTV